MADPRITYRTEWVDQPAGKAVLVEVLPDGTDGRRAHFYSWNADAIAAFRDPPDDDPERKPLAAIPCGSVVQR